MLLSFLPARAGRALLLAGAAALTLSACAASRSDVTGSIRPPDFASQSEAEARATLGQLAERYRQDPSNRTVAAYYSAALRSAGQSSQAVAVLETALEAHRDDAGLRLAFAKALTADGRFEQALNVVDGATRPDAPDWNALSVRGAILDQLGRNHEARASYMQALLIAPEESGLYANLGLSYAMTGELPAAERELRRAVALPGATVQVRQNLALVVGLQGRFEEARALYASVLPPDKVEANMAYLTGMLSQQNRWEQIRAQ